MITTTYNIGDKVFFCEGNTIEQVEVTGAIVKGSDESYFVKDEDGRESQRKVETLYSSVDNLANVVAALLTTKFEAEITALKTRINSAKANYDAHKEKSEEERATREKEYLDELNKGK